MAYGLRDHVAPALVPHASSQHLALSHHRIVREDVGAASEIACSGSMMRFLTTTSSLPPLPMSRFPPTWSKPYSSTVLPFSKSALPRTQTDPPKPQLPSTSRLPPTISDGYAGNCCPGGAPACRLPVPTPMRPGPFKSALPSTINVAMGQSDRTCPAPGCPAPPMFTDDPKLPRLKITIAGTASMFVHGNST